jgi:phosphopantothenoylcysteine decarboxylase/phosphopantothenate--cysteine ligase
MKRGAQVTMVMGPNALPRIEGVAYVEVETALEMASALRKIEKDFDVLIMTAAVADARPVTVERKKIKKEALGAILLEENPDLLHGAAKRRLPGQILVGFAAETTPEEGDLKELGAAKLKRKEVDLLFVNDVSGGAVFGSDRTGGFLLDAEGAVKKFTSIAKQDLARQLIDEIEKRLV